MFYRAELNSEEKDVIERVFQALHIFEHNNREYAQLAFVHFKLEREIEVRFHEKMMMVSYDSKNRRILRIGNAQIMATNSIEENEIIIII